MDLSTTYLGLRLPNPLMPGASPMADQLDWVKRLEDAGASAIVLRSLFEEQITHEQQGMIHHMEVHEEGFAEALSYFPKPDNFVFGPAEYLEHIRKVKAAVKLPVIASLNGVTAEGWLEYAKHIEQAGADALELNYYLIATDPYETGNTVEHRLLDVARTVKASVKIPLAVKLSPFFSSVANLARKLDETGIDGFVLFNRFYQPDFDLEALDAVPSLHLSDSTELLLRLRWLSILSGKVRGSLAASGGVHTGLDAIKAVAAGASAVQIVSALLQNGPRHIKTLREQMSAWLEQHEYASLEQARGSMSLERSPNPAAFERGNYVRILQSYRIKA
jgi:dihydroorotate dehydrogenase (fumarate)